MGALKLDDLPRYTYEEYKKWEGQWEIIYGIAYAMSPMPMIKHQHISTRRALSGVHPLPSPFACRLED